MSAEWRSSLSAGESCSPMLGASADALLDPQVLLEAVKDSSGHIVEFIYRELNQATCDYLGSSREELLGRGVVELMPCIRETLFPAYVRCLVTAEPLIVDDFSHDNQVLYDKRRYDLRVTRATPTCIILTWRDVTERFEAAQRLTQARDLLRATTDAMFNPHALIEMVTTSAGDVDLLLLDVNKAFCEYIGSEPADLVGQSILTTFPSAIGSGLMEHYIRCATTGEPVALDDFHYFAELTGDVRHFDIRAAQVDIGRITLTVRDTTSRFEAAHVLAESEQRYRLLAENAGDVVIHIRDGTVVWVSPSVERVFGAPADYWIGREAQEVIPLEDRAAFENRHARVAAGETLQQRVRVVSIDGVTHWIHLHSRPFYDVAGGIDGVISALRLIDDEVAAEDRADEARRARSRADALYRRSVESAAVGMCLARPEGTFLQVNEALCEFFGYAADALLEKTWIELTAPEYLQADLDKVVELVAGRIESYRMVKQFIHADGHRLWGDLSVGCLRRADGSIEVTIGQVIDITAQVEAERQLERLARFDTLTGLASRAEVIGRLESDLAQVPHSPLAVLFCDVDHFKVINDQLGHPVGDVVLSTLAQRIRQYVRKGDTVGRMGGDEILILLPGVYHIDEATRIAENIRRHVAEPICDSGQTVKVTLSIGAVLAASGETATTVLARADAAMYEAKARRDAVIGIP